MTPTHNDPPICAVCGARPAQSIVAGKDERGETIRIPTCGACFSAADHTELRLFRQSLRLVIGGWPR